MRSCPYIPVRWLTLAVRLRLMYDIAYYLHEDILCMAGSLYLAYKMKNRGNKHGL